jgi:hypothetical protein
MLGTGEFTDEISSKLSLLITDMNWLDTKGELTI